MTRKCKGSELIASYLNKNDNMPHIITDTHLNKLLPVARSSEIMDEIIRISESGNVKHLKEILSMVLSNPHVVVMGGMLFKMIATTGLRSIDSKIDSKVIDIIRDREMEHVISNTKELFLECIGRLWTTNRSSIDFITQKDYARERIQFSIEPISIMENVDGGMIEKRDFAVYATKYVPKITIRYESKLYPDDPTKNGVWEFSDAIIGIQIVGQKNSDGMYTLGFKEEPKILFPKPFIHPYTRNNGGMCTGSFKGSSDMKKIKSMPFLSSVYHYLIAIEQLLKTGYSEKSFPLRAHLSSHIFQKRTVHKFSSFAEERKFLLEKTARDYDGMISELRRSMQ